MKDCGKRLKFGKHAGKKIGAGDQSRPELAPSVIRDQSMHRSISNDRRTGFPQFDFVSFQEKHLRSTSLSMDPTKIGDHQFFFFSGIHKSFVLKLSWIVCAMKPI